MFKKKEFLASMGLQLNKNFWFTTLFALVPFQFLASGTHAAASTDSAESISSAPSSSTPPQVLVAQIDTPNCQLQPFSTTASLAACLGNYSGAGCTSGALAGQQIYNCPAGTVAFGISTSANVSSNGTGGTGYFNIYFTVNCCPIVYHWRAMPPACSASVTSYCIK